MDLPATDHAGAAHAGAAPVNPDGGMGRFDIANRLFLRLYQASNLLHKTGTRAVSGFGATTQQWAVLGALSRPAVHERGMTIKGLIAFLIVSRQNLTAVLDRPQGAGLVERVRTAGDGRLRHVRLTPEGDRAWSDMSATIRKYYEDAPMGFSTEECVVMFGLLDRLRDSLGRIADPEGE